MERALHFLRSPAIRLAPAIAVLCLAPTVPSLAETYYVSPEGAEGAAGTQDNPLDISRILHDVALAPGDQVVFLDGTYSVGDLLSRDHKPQAALHVLAIQFLNGTPDSPITFRAEHRHQVVLDGGTAIAGWTKAPGPDPVWQCRLPWAPDGIIIHGQPLLAPFDHASAGVTAIREGVFTVEQHPFPHALGEADSSSGAEPTSRNGNDVRVSVWAWGGRSPLEGHAVATFLDTVVQISASSHLILDGFVIRHAGNVGLGVGADSHHVIVRNCVVRDVCRVALGCNTSRHITVEDSVIYNVGSSQRDHGLYASAGSEDVVLRRNIWWAISGGSIHIFSGSAVDTPARFVVEYNIIGPDKGDRCFPLGERRSTAIYLWGGQRGAGYHRVAHNIVFGGHDRAISQNNADASLIANNLFLDCREYAFQLATGADNVVANNIIEPGRQGYYICWQPAQLRPQSDHNLFIPPASDNARVRWLIGEEAIEDLEALRQTLPLFERHSRLAARDPFVDRGNLDFRPRPGSEALRMGILLPTVTPSDMPYVGALGPGEEMFGPNGKFPDIPSWLLAASPLPPAGP